MYIPLTIGCCIAIVISSYFGGRYSSPVNIAASIIIALDYYVI